MRIPNCIYIIYTTYLSRKALDLHGILVAHISVAGGPKLQDKMERVLALLWNKDDCMDKYSSLLVDCNQDLHTLVLGSVFIKFMAGKQADVSKVRIIYFVGNIVGEDIIATIKMRNIFCYHFSLLLPI